MESEKIAEGQASIEVRAHAATLAGRPIGPYLLTIKLLLPFLADALSFFVSVCTLAVISAWRVPTARLREVPRRQLRREIGDGFRWLRENLDAGAIMLLMSFTTLIAQALILIFLSEAHDKKLSTVAIGVVLAASGVGGAIGSMVAGRLPSKIKTSWLQIQLIAWAFAIGLLASTGVTLAWCIAIAMLVLGLTGSIGNIEFGTYLVKNVSDGMLGRVTSIAQVVTMGAMGVGPMLGGTVIQKWGIQAAAWLFLGLALLMLIASFTVPLISRPTAGGDDASPYQASGEASSPSPEPEPTTQESSIEERQLQVLLRMK